MCRHRNSTLDFVGDDILNLGPTTWLSWTHTRRKVQIMLCFHQFKAPTETWNSYHERLKLWVWLYCKYDDSGVPSNSKCSSQCHIWTRLASRSNWPVKLWCVKGHDNDLGSSLIQFCWRRTNCRLWDNGITSFLLNKNICLKYYWDKSMRVSCHEKRRSVSRVTSDLFQSLKVIATP